MRIKFNTGEEHNFRVTLTAIGDREGLIGFPPFRDDTSLLEFKDGKEYQLHIHTKMGTISRLLNPYKEYRVELIKDKRDLLKVEEVGSD